MFSIYFVKFYNTISQKSHSDPVFPRPIILSFMDLYSFNKSSVFPIFYRVYSFVNLVNNLRQKGVTYRLDRLFPSGSERNGEISQSSGIPIISAENRGLSREGPPAICRRGGYCHPLYYLANTKKLFNSSNNSNDISFPSSDTQGAYM